MGSFRMLLQPLILLMLAHSTGAFVYSCEEVKYNLVNTNFAQYSKYACLITREGFNNTDQLKKLTLNQGKWSTGLTSIVDWCMEIEDGDAWTITAPKGFTLNCDRGNQEFTLILTSEDTNLVAPKNKITAHSVERQRVFVVPQVGMWIRNKGCKGAGSINFWTGAGTGESEERFALRSWTCDTIPDWIYFLDTVVTVEANGQATFNVECSTLIELNLERAPLVSPRETVVVIGSGRSDNVQNLKGREINACVRIKEATDVAANIQVSLDPSNSGAVGLEKNFAGPITQFHNGTYSQKWQTDYFEVRWLPKGLQPIEIGNNQDNFYVELSLTKNAPAPVANGAYCTCDVDKTGYATGWEYNEIWVDVIFILDTSEAMGATALKNAGNLVESILADGNDEFLSTDVDAEFFTRVGVIAMSDTAQVLYNLDMENGDKVQSKVSIKKGLAGIDVVSAYTAALNMFNEGLKNNPSRAAARQVIYYMTATDPKINLATLDQFKRSGVIVVNNFITGGKDLAGLKKLASDGYYFTSTSNMESLRTLCKANCYCKPDQLSYGKTVDPAMTADGGCYHPDLAALPFNKAKSTCAIDGGLIAAIHEESKGRYLQDLLTKAKSDYFWIGYEKASSGSWAWEDESTQPYTNWDVDEPMESSVAKCAYVDSTQSKLPWGAGNCQVGFPYVCEYRPCAAGNKDC